MSKQEKMFALVEDYKASGLSGSPYCEKHGIYRSLLYYWIRKFNDSASCGGFIEIRPKSQVTKIIEMKYPNGVSITVPTSELDLLLTLIKSY